MSLPDFQVRRPRTVEEALEFLAVHDSTAQVIAGGTDLIPSMRRGLFAPEYVIDLRGMEELRGIRVQTGVGVEIGALTPLAAIEDSEFIRRYYPVLHEAVSVVASPILRNMATIGGNVCLNTRCLWYNQSLAWLKSCGFCLKRDGEICHVMPGASKCWAVFSGDTPPALLCLDAEVEIAGPNGFRRLPLRDFYTGIGDGHHRLERNEMLTRIYLPAASAGWRGAYRKLRVRHSIDHPLAGVAVALKVIDIGAVMDARIAITGVNPAPMLVSGAEHALIGRRVDEHDATVVGELAAKTAKPLATSALTPEYRRQMVSVLAKRTVLAAGSPQMR